MSTDARLFGLPAEKGRWLFIVFGFFINICLGSVYAYSVFKVPVQELFSVGALQGGMPYMIFLAFFAGLFPFGGRMLEKMGPRKVGLLGAIIVGAGWMLSSRASGILFLNITYGVIAGAGVGLAYGGPIATAVRWFPDKKGLAVGLTVAGFGGSPFVTAYVASRLIAAYGALATFLYLGIAFLALLLLLSIPLRFPAQGWKPAGWSPGAAGAAVHAKEYDTHEMAKTSSFWGLFVCFMIGSLAGLMAIGISSPVATEVISIDRTVAASLVGVFAIFNGLGRPLFGILTDKLTPRYAAVLNLVLIMLMSVGMLFAGTGMVALYVACFIGFWLCLGGWLAIAPTTTATHFGAAYYARNYGVMLLAYGAGAILANIISGQAKDVFGSYLYAFYPTAALAAVGIVLALVFIKPPAVSVKS
ncbi:MAG: MFS transporter [Spirochaetes bacterium]|nr:MAG: MFS transporter [Spirochaetota bacterium]